MRSHTKKKPAPAFHFTFSMEVYNYELMFSVGEADAKLATALRRKGINPHPAMIDYGGDTCPAKYAFWQENLFGLIRMRVLPETSRQFAALAHEIFHIVSWFMEHMGFELDAAKSGEAYAYLISYITDQIYTEMNKYY